MTSKQAVAFHSVRASLGSEIDSLDPLVSRAKLPPTDGQFEAAQKLGINIVGKNPGSASIAIAQARRALAQDLIKRHKYVPGMECVLDGKIAVVIQRVNSAKKFFAENGSQVFVKTLVKPTKTRWVHPYRLEPK